MKTASLIAANTLLVVATSAQAGYTFTQQTAPTQTYGQGLNFDEAGGPTGSVAATAWQANYGLSIGNGNNPNESYVDNFSGSFPWVSNNNACAGTFGIGIDFDTAVDGFSFQAWDDSGPPTFNGGGFYVYVTDANYGNAQVIDGAGFTPAWGGVGKTWYNITATGGSSFSHVIITGNSFFPTTVMDNLSWHTVPGPGGIALLSLGFMGRGRRRA